VPVLHFRTGVVRSSIGNSPEILRYLWGRYGAELGDKTAFLEPDSERLEFEKKIDRIGADLQVWVYFHIPGQEFATVFRSEAVNHTFHSAAGCFDIDISVTAAHVGKHPARVHGDCRNTVFSQVETH